MASNNEEDPIPTGWTKEITVNKDGSKTLEYRCTGTKQQFYTYFDMMRYVKFAKEREYGIYCKDRKVVKGNGKVKPWKEGRYGPAKFLKTASLSLPKKPAPNQNPPTVEPSKFLSRTRKEGRNGAAKFPKTASLSLPKRPAPNQNPPTVEPSLDSRPSSSGVEGLESKD